QPDRDGAAADARAEREGHPAALEDRALDLLHAVDLPLLVPRLLDVPLVDDDPRPELEPLHRGLETGDLLLLRRVVLLLPSEGDLLLDDVGRVIAFPEREPRASRPV